MKLNFIPMPRRSPAAMFRSLSTVAFVAFALAVPRVCQADMLKFHVDFGDTSSLGSDYSIFADLNNNGLGTANSTTLHFQNFTGQTGTIPDFDLSDVSNFNEASQTFVTGSPVAPSPFGFDFFADFTPDNSANADQLSFFFGANDPSSHPDTANLFTVTFNSADPALIGYSTHSNTNPNVPAPTLTISTVLTPEPSTWAMMALGMGALFFLARKKRQSAQEAVPATVLA